MDEDGRAERHADGEQRDERLVAALRAAAGRLDPVPEDAVLAARSMLAHLRLDAELAQLVFDSEEDGALVGLRSDTPTVRQVAFAAGTAQVEFEIVPEGDRRRLVGQCVPATEVTLTVHRRDDTAAGAERVVWLETVTDELGRFVVEVPSGEVSLRCVWAFAALAIETEWMSV